MPRRTPLVTTVVTAVALCVLMIVYAPGISAVNCYPTAVNCSAEEQGQIQAGAKDTHYVLLNMLTDSLRSVSIERLPAGENKQFMFSGEDTHELGTQGITATSYGDAVYWRNVVAQHEAELAKTNQLNRTVRMLTDGAPIEVYPVDERPYTMEVSGTIQSGVPTEFRISAPYHVQGTIEFGDFSPPVMVNLWQGTVTVFHTYQNTTAEVQQYVALLNMGNGIETTVQVSVPPMPATPTSTVVPSSTATPVSTATPSSTATPVSSPTVTATTNPASPTASVSPTVTTPSPSGSTATPTSTASQGTVTPVIPVQPVISMEARRTSINPSAEMETVQILITTDQPYIGMLILGDGSRGRISMVEAGSYMVTHTYIKNTDTRVFMLEIRDLPPLSALRATYTLTLPGIGNTPGISVYLPFLQR